MIRSWNSADGVYPRTRGETSKPMLNLAENPGLSPHARGNRRGDVEGLPWRGSIPARAGKPRRRRMADSAGRVYPRTRGETRQHLQRDRLGQGLSPHARGNPGQATGRRGQPGSIPARAGKPIPWRCGGRLREVYPRTRGETVVSLRGGEFHQGLSPHARGNQFPAAHRSRTRGSIPARAGKPPWPARRGTGSRVYPRTRGETPGQSSLGAGLRGLSPHARGNHSAASGSSVESWSIPARAGKPMPYDRLLRWVRVYPRTRGETTCSAVNTVATPGLSPHARGNRTRHLSRSRGEGSIPARAGKPYVRPQHRATRRVYPRTRGETFRARAWT